MGAPDANQNLSPARFAHRVAKVREVAAVAESEFEKNGYCTEETVARILGLDIRTVQKRVRWVKPEWPLRMADLPACYQTHQPPLLPPGGDTNN